MSKQVNYNENLVAGAAIRDDKGRRISKLFEAPHPKMTVGYAKNLIMPDDPTEQKFNFRQAGGGLIEDGVAVIDKVKGNSVVWNQWEVKQTAENSSEEWDNSKRFWGTCIVSGSLSFNKDSSIISYSFNDNNGFFRGHKGSGYIVGHKYVILVNAKANTNCLSLTTGDNGVNHSGSGNWELMSLFFTAKIDSYSNLGLRLSGETSFPQAISQSQWKTIDLTQMFGAGNEPATYEEFLSRKPKVADEYAYNEGTIVNNKVEKVVTTGRNLWDEQWELGAYNKSTGEKIASSNQIRSKNMFACLPHTSYYWMIPNKANGTYMGNCLFYDISRAFISGAPVGPSSFSTVTTPNNARFVAFDLRTEYGTAYNHDICINLSDPAINGKYFPYEEHTLDLSWVKDIKDSEGVKLFEDGMRSAGTAFDEVVKNKAVKRVGSVDLGSLIWKIDSRQRFEATIPNAPNKKPAQSTDIPNALLIGYLTDSGANMYNHINDKAVGFDGNGRIKVYDTSYTSLVDFQTAMQGQNLYYELAEPIEVEYDEKSLTYPVVAGGTEEAIASEPSSAFRADIGYGIDAVKTILDLKARVEALEEK